MKRILILLVCAWPASPFKNWLLRQWGYQIPSTASFGPCLVSNVDFISLGDNARIGPFNVFRDLKSMELGESAVIGQWNWLSAARPLVLGGDQGTFRLGRESALTSRHYVDASGGVEIGSLTTVAGVRSTFITHGIDWKLSRQSTRPIRIGSHCLISSNVALTPGVVIPDRVIVGMGATVAGVLPDTDTLYVASRAQPVKSGVAGAYFVRDRGFVSAPEDRRA